MNPGSRRDSRRRLVDMAVAPVVEEYKPPAEHLCEEHAMPIALDDLVEICAVQQVYRGKIVHFSIEIKRRAHAMADPSVCYRIDTSHGEVHQHIYKPDGSERREVLEVIPTGKGADSWDFVDAWYERASEMCFNDVETHVERWA